MFHQNLWFVKGNTGNLQVDQDGSKTVWIYWTIVGASILLALILSIALYDLICRCRERFKSQQIVDGGPPASPAHNFLYTVGCHADQASPSFDTQLSIIRIELLDNLNRYITSIAIPCFLLKFKQVNSQTKVPEEKTKPLHPMHIKSLSILHETWAGTEPGERVTFQMSRRQALMNVTSARVSHDCYIANATITLKYIVLYDQSARIYFMIHLKNIQLRSIHPCPPSGLQVFPVEKVVSHEELKSFMDITQTRYMFCCPCIGNH